MCGLAGTLAYQPEAPPVDPRELLKVREAMSLRGPDGSGLWISDDGRVGLAHRRLAIIDLSEAAAQPMATADGRFRIVFNGEIYNYKELRRDLLARGSVFRTESDTEVLLQLYAVHGRAMVALLRGMFAFAIWDARERSLLLARDPFGIKPLYFADDGRTIRFASQVKALLAGGGVDTKPDPAGHVGFLVLGSVPEPYTMYRSIRNLPAGTTLFARQGSADVQRYFEIASEYLTAREAPTPSDRRGVLADALRNSVRHHLVSDVPVGIFLSAGVDSNIIASLAVETPASGPLRSITLAVEQYRGTSDDESVIAEHAARKLGLDHEAKWIGDAEVQAEVESIFLSMDQPSIDGINTWFVSKAASQRGMKVALSGLGGDELFGGYPSFNDVPRIARLLRPMKGAPTLARVLRRLSAPVLGALISPKYAGLLEYGGDLAGAYLLRRALYMPWEARRLLDPHFYDEGWERLALLDEMAASTRVPLDDRQAVSTLEMAWYQRNQLLRDADWAGMAHSIEIRVPFVDVELFRTVASLHPQGAVTKREAANTLVRPLANDLLSRPKTGFQVPVRGGDRQKGRTGGWAMRQWAQRVYHPYRSAHILSLVTDAFGGHGGIALYNRDLLASLCEMPECHAVTALPRRIPLAMEQLPRGLRHMTSAAGSKVRYVHAVFTALFAARYDAVLCCHINLLGPALLASWWKRVPLVLVIYGIDAWSARSWIKRHQLRHVDRVVSISDVTLQRFLGWSGVGRDRCAILPNAIHTEWYGPGEPEPRLVERYGLEGRTVIMTLGRLVSEERYKGFDEVLEVMPALAKEIPGLTYLIAGYGSDRERLERKATELGIADHVRFTGPVPEGEKAAHYRLAHAFVMPSRGEGFGFVLLEAMACGIPVVASSVDGGREAVRGGELGILVDPADAEEVKRGIRAALASERGKVPPGLAVFDFPHFKLAAAGLMREAIAR